MNAPVAIVGGGDFGCSLARVVERVGREVMIWSRSTPTGLSSAIRVTDEMADLASSELLLFAVPSQHIRQVATDVGKHLDGRHYLVHVSRGLEGDELTPLSHVLREVTPCRRIGVLAGPLIAEALNQAAPSGAIVASPFAEVRRAVQRAIASATLRVYETTDLVGVELTSAIVGVLALAAGIAKGSSGGPASLAIVMARGFAEASRLAEVIGADPKSLIGLAGLGDAMALASGDDRPELKVGVALAQGLSAKEAATVSGSHIEGIRLSSQLAHFGERAGIELPIITAVRDVVSGTISVDRAIDALMRRPQRSE